MKIKLKMKMIKKTIFLIIVVLFVSLNITSAKDINSTGNGEWSVVVDIDYDVKSSTKVIISHVVTADDEVRVLFNGTLNIISDSLIINAGLVTFIGGNVYVAEGAVLYIDGDLNNFFNGNLVVDGTVKVNGDVSNWGSNIIVSETGTLAVDGDINNSGGAIDNKGNIIVGGTVSGNDIDNSGGGTLRENVIDPLPIKLLYFKGYNINNYKTVFEWATAIEINNDYFIIEYSEDIINWEVLDIIFGAGNSNIEITYKREYPMKYSYYYRLTQVDYNGDFEIFNIIYVKSQYIDNELIYGIYDVSGRFVEYNSIKNLSYGIYLININDEFKKIIIR